MSTKHPLGILIMLAVVFSFGAARSRNWKTVDVHCALLVAGVRKVVCDRRGR